MRPSGAVKLLVAINFASLHPTVLDRTYISGNLHLLRSMFGSGWVFDGRHLKLQVDSLIKINSLVHRICHSQVVLMVESLEKEVLSEKINMS